MIGIWGSGFGHISGFTHSFGIWGSGFDPSFRIKSHFRDSLTTDRDSGLGTGKVCGIGIQDSGFTGIRDSGFGTGKASASRALLGFRIRRESHSPPASLDHVSSCGASFGLPQSTFSGLPCLSIWHRGLSHGPFTAADQDPDDGGWFPAAQWHGVRQLSAGV